MTFTSFKGFPFRTSRSGEEDEDSSISPLLDDEDDTFLLLDSNVSPLLRSASFDPSLVPIVTWRAAAVLTGALDPDDGQVMVLGMFDVPAPAENPIGLRVIETTADHLCDAGKCRYTIRHGFTAHGSLVVLKARGVSPKK